MTATINTKVSRGLSSQRPKILAVSLSKVWTSALSWCCRGCCRGVGEDTAVFTAASPSEAHHSACTSDATRCCRVDATSARQRRTPETGPWTEWHHRGTA